MKPRNPREDMTNKERLQGLMLPNVKVVVIKVIVVPFASTRSLKERNLPKFTLPKQDICPKESSLKMTYLI